MHYFMYSCSGWLIEFHTKIITDIDDSLEDAFEFQKKLNAYTEGVYMGFYISVYM